MHPPPARISPTLPPPIPARLPDCIGRALRACCRWLLLPLVSLWPVAALAIDFPIPGLRIPAALCYVVFMGAILLRTRRLPHAAGIVASGFLVVLAGWLLLRPSNDRVWQPDVATLAHAEIVGSKVTVHGIRNCFYRSETDYDAVTYDKTFDLDQLESLDFYTVYWGSPTICHTMLSFGFSNGDHLCASIEARKEAGEGYSALLGFFRRFEIIYILADERDLIGLRTNFRHEEVYLYRLQADRDLIRGVFLGYIRTANELYRQPRWYNALTSNCTTNIRSHTRPYAGDARWDWRLLINGRVDEMAYERGRLDQSLPFPELKKRSRVPPVPEDVVHSPDFSRHIRLGHPGMEHLPVDSRAPGTEPIPPS